MPLEPLATRRLKHSNITIPTIRMMHLDDGTIDDFFVRENISRRMVYQRILHNKAIYWLVFSIFSFV